MVAINEEIFKEVLCNNIRIYRNESQEIIAEKAQISPDTLSLIERKRTMPNGITILKIANALNVTPNHLLNELIDNKTLCTRDIISREIANLSQEDLDFILYTINFIKKNHKK